MKTVTVEAIVLAVLVGLGSVARAEVKQPEEPARPRIEVVFVLDTTGSMGGLIQGAKGRIWAIANTLASARPTPEIAMGLVGYRDRGDEYVTRRTNLTDDLDVVYRDLMGFQANGGGDAPESVNQALFEAVTKIGWSRNDATYRVIYLVGDCPPHMDYKDDVKYPDTCKKAAAAGVIINTIQCGDHASTTPIWRDIANRAEGAYFRVEQSGGAVAVTTPFDKEMAELSTAMGKTRIYYGTAEEREELARRGERSSEIIAKAAAPAVADRAMFLSREAGAKSFAGRQELVTEVLGGKLKPEDVDEKLLPEGMRGMTSEERRAFVQKQIERRKELQAKIQKLHAKRRAYIEKELREKGLKGKDSFEKAILDSMREQAAKKGIIYEEVKTEKAH